MLSRSILSVALGLSCLIGCATSRIPLTQELREQHNLSDRELANLQYFTSNTITLRREVDSTGRQITGGHKLVLTSGKTVEEFVIKQGTPGVAVEVGPRHLVVRFGPEANLRFALRTDGIYTNDPPPDRGYAQPPEAFPVSQNPLPRPSDPPARTGLTGYFWLSPDRPGNLVAFQGKWFEAIKETLDAHLLVAAEELDDVDENKTVLPGVKLQ